MRGLASGRATCGTTVVRESINEEAPLEGDQPCRDREVNVRNGSRGMAVGAKGGQPNRRGATAPEGVRISGRGKL